MSPTTLLLILLSTVSASLLRSIDIGDTSFSHPYSRSINRFINDLPIKVSNGSLIIIDRNGRLTFDEQDLLIQLIKENEKKPFILVDSDESSIEPSVYLRHISCNRGLIPSLSLPHTAFTCNLPSTLLSPIHPTNEKKEFEFTLLPIFASAKSTKRREDSEEDDDDDDDDVIVEKKEKDRRLPCKYRKSCYESGILPELKEIFHQPQEKVEVQEDDEEEEEDEGKLSTKRKLRCKYRESCYESGKLPKIDSSSLFSSPSIKDQEDEISFEEMNDIQKKVHCKYRKSCYENGELPEELNPQVENEEKKDEDDENDDDEEDEEGKISIKRKLRCKYRESCYESGKLPEVLNPTEGMEISSEIKLSVDPRLDCKYRKSCYEKEEKEQKIEKKERRKEEAKIEEPSKKKDKKEIKKEEKKKEEKPREEKKKVVHVEIKDEIKKEPKKTQMHDTKKGKKEVEEEDSNEVEEIIEKKIEKVVVEAPKKIEKVVEKKQKKEEKKSDEVPKKKEKKEEQKEEESVTVSVPLSSINRTLVSVGDKLDCKYRTSCYQSVVEKKEMRRPTTSSRATTISIRDPSVRCHKYILSCREELGLPPKEKVPIGPSGRKLCRKKKE